MLFKTIALALAAAPLAAAVTSLEIQGSSFVNPQTNKKFQIIGMAYQPGGEAGFDPSGGKDPLSDGATCLRDAALMQKLGINTIRVYNLGPDINHDECASIFNAAGIYMILDVNGPQFPDSLNRDEPWTTYFSGYLNHTFGVIEAFKGYPNTLAFFSANEVINAVGTGQVVPPYLRAVTRDLKNYVKKHATRPIPVGYSAADVRDVLDDTFKYLVCDNDGDNSNADFFALNSYSWCGPDATFESSTYSDLVAMFKDSAVPVFLSEYGCNTPAPRYFNEIQAIYSDPMATTFSGGIVYEWTMEANDFGVVQVNADGSVKLLADYDTLTQQYAKLDVATLENGAPAAGTAPPPTCSPGLITESNFSNNFTIPVVPPGGQPMVDNGISPAPVGRIVPVADYAVGLKITDASGDTVTGLAVTPLADNASNVPGATGSGVSGSGGSGGGSNNAGSPARPGGSLWVGTAAALSVVFGIFALA